MLWKKVCLCRGVTKEQIIESIKNGAKTFEDVKEKTGAGTGGCRGGRCEGTIETLIKVYEE
nr:(2Fe-2S)-binding protein [Clostridium senegalense]